jgi:hypothetical protein
MTQLMVSWRVLRIHGPVLGLLVVLVFLAYGRLCTGDFWHPLDFSVLADTHAMSLDPLARFQHIGAWFSQPLLQLAFLLEYRLFGLDYGSYIAVNLALHALCAFLIYMLVNMLFYHERMALLAAVLFALCVGNYGRVLQTLADQESLLLGFLHLLVLYLFIRNDFRRDGRLRSSYFLAGLLIYSLTGLTRASTLSLLGCLVAYKAFFYQRRERRPIFSNDLLVFLAVGLIFQVGQNLWGYRGPSTITEVDGPLVYTFWSIVNVFRYLNLMVFPLQESELLLESGWLVQAIYQVRVPIRAMVTLGVLSFSFFGFVFGNRSLRFFIAWTYISLLPFSTQAPEADWLNLTHLYLASLGFCLVLATGSISCANLLGRHRWRRLIPFTVPLLFVLTSLSLTYRLDERNREDAASPEIQRLRHEVLQQIHGGPPAGVSDVQRSPAQNH